MAIVENFSGYVPFFRFAAMRKIMLAIALLSLGACEPEKKTETKFIADHLQPLLVLRKGCV
jgi:hypothetical protein